MPPLEVFGYLASVLMGLSLGLIGGGGSILTVPILVYLFSVNPITATAYSLFIVGLTALIGGLSYLKRGDVDLKTGFVFGIPSFMGVYLTRAYLVPRIPDPVLQFGSIESPFTLSKPLLIMLVFSVLMVAASVSMIRERKATASPKLSARAKWMLIPAEGLIVGAVTGFVGAGGGFLIIPALVVLVGMPMKIAVGTSLFIIAAKSLIGFTGDLQNLAVIDWRLLFTIASIAIAGLFLGMRYSRTISERTLKRSFGLFVLIMGSVILLDQLRQL